jgi:hypothetical protein
MFKKPKLVFLIIVVFTLFIAGLAISRNTIDQPIKVTPEPNSNAQQPTPSTQATSPPATPPPPTLKVPIDTSSLDQTEANLNDSLDTELDNSL